VRRVESSRRRRNLAQRIYPLPDIIGDFIERPHLHPTRQPRALHRCQPRGRDAPALRAIGSPPNWQGVMVWRRSAVRERVVRAKRHSFGLRRGAKHREERPAFAASGIPGSESISHTIDRLAAGGTISLLVSPRGVKMLIQILRTSGLIESRNCASVARSFGHRT
jgi:hypothetical protein